MSLRSTVWRGWIRLRDQTNITIFKLEGNTLHLCCKSIWTWQVSVMWLIEIKQEQKIEMVTHLKDQHSQYIERLTEKLKQWLKLLAYSSLRGKWRPLSETEREWSEGHTNIIKKKERGFIMWFH